MVDLGREVLNVKRELLLFSLGTSKVRERSFCTWAAVGGGLIRVAILEAVIPMLMMEWTSSSWRWNYQERKRNMVQRSHKITAGNFCGKIFVDFIVYKFNLKKHENFPTHT